MLCSPYKDHDSKTRKRVRSMFGSGSFIEVFVDTPLNICESPGPKGMYLLVRRGKTEKSTGMDDFQVAGKAAQQGE